MIGLLIGVAFISAMVCLLTMKKDVAPRRWQTFGFSIFFTLGLIGLVTQQFGL